jgi:hypothetical protein
MGAEGFAAGALALGAMPQLSRTTAATTSLFTSAPWSAGLSSLAEGQKVFFEIKLDPKRGKSSAENLRV